MEQSFVNLFRRKCLTHFPIYDQQIRLDTITEDSSRQLLILLLSFYWVQFRDISLAFLWYRGFISHWYYSTSLSHYTLSSQRHTWKIPHQKLVTWPNIHNEIIWGYKGPRQHKESSHELCRNYREGHKAPQVRTKERPGDSLMKKGLVV